MNDSRPYIRITSFTESDIHKKIDEIEKIHEMNPLSQPLIIEIDSYGGSIYGLALIYNKLITLGRPIVTYTSSKAMSAGAILLSAAGTPGLRFANQNADIMVHEIQSMAMGDIKDLEDSLLNLRKINNKWMKILAKSMGLKTAKDIRNLIKEKAIGLDVNLTAKKALELGIIDEIGTISIQPNFYWEVVKK